MPPKNSKLVITMDIISSANDVLANNSDVKVLYPAYWQSTAIKTDKLFHYLTGQGVQKNNCGFIKTFDNEKMKILMCSSLSCRHVRVFKNHCDNPECPECFPNWVQREANSAYQRMNEAKKEYDKVGIHLRYPRHLIFSPEQSSAKILMESVEGYDKLKKEHIKTLKYADVRGGCFVFHPFRIKKSMAQELRKKGYGIGKSGHGSLWRGIHDNALGLSSKEAYCVKSPHFHNMGFGFLKKSDIVYEKTGWVYKNKGVRITEREIKGTLKYFLNHAGLQKVEGAQKRRGHVMVWYGLLAYNKIKKDGKKEVREKVLCPLCNSEMHVFHAEPNDDGSPNIGILSDNDDLGVYVRTFKRPKYVLNMKFFKKIQKTLGGDKHEA